MTIQRGCPHEVFSVTQLHGPLGFLSPVSQSLLHNWLIFYCPIHFFFGKTNRSVSHSCSDIFYICMCICSRSVYLHMYIHTYIYTHICTHKWIFNYAKGWYPSPNTVQGLSVFIKDTFRCGFNLQAHTLIIDERHCHIFCNADFIFDSPVC